MPVSLRRWAKSVTAAATVALIATFVQLPVVARADTKPIDESDPKTPVTVAADPLPTVQIDGVAWTQLVIGNTVYVGGSFATARPAGAPAGTNTVTRSNLLAYDITTGVLKSAWAPSTNGDVLALAASPDNSRIYIGGSFTTVNGQIRNRIAAVDPTSGALVNGFDPKPDASVKAIAATADTVYFGGVFSSVGGVARTKVAAAQASNGALLSWAPTLAGGNVNALKLSPDNGKVVLGGSFTSVNGSGNPGYGLAAVDPATGASLAFPANSLIRNGGPSAAILSLSSDADSLYATGYTYGSGGNLEGTTRINWSDLSLAWVEDCHGDTYGSYAMGDVVYASTHAHYCGNLPDGPPQTNPWTFHWGLAFTKSVEGTLGPDPLGYYNFAGTPSPYLLKWEPMMASGTYTGQNQASWTVAGNDKYVVYGGEFPRTGASNTTQQGLVRYAVRTIAPNKQGPEITGAKFNPVLTSFVRGQVRVSWTANWDRDNEFLTYKVIRDGVTNQPVYTTTAPSSQWNRPGMGYVDNGLVPGQTYRYRIFASDPWGNEARSDTVYVTVSSDGELSSYAEGVLDDGASPYWRFGESPSSTVNDWAGFGNAKANTGVSGGQDGAIINDANKASSFSGTSSGFAVADGGPTQAPNTFSAEAWFKTTSNSGGKIIGFGNAASGNSGSYDRHVYMTNQGRITFGAYPGSVQTVSSSKTYNDGDWHHVVASLSTSGMALYVDGLKVGARTDVTTGQAYQGYWRVGGDNLGGWPSVGASYFAGSIDEVAIYPAALSAAKIRQHYLNSGRTLAGASAPADQYGSTVYGSDPDLYWRLSEANGQTALDSSPNQSEGTYNTGVTLGGGSGIGLAGDTSATFSGTSSGTAASKQSYSNPTTFTEELWFRTATTKGGKLIGFSSNQTGNSGSYDRHVYMINSGQLRFGVWTGTQNIVESAKAYNDDKWHYLVAQQDASGMKLYVDNELVGTNAQTSAQSFTGYWRIGGDTTWGGNDSNFFAGSLDEVAVYSRTMSDAERSDHFLKGGGSLPNVAPVADFQADVVKKKVTFTSAASDTDGTVTDYHWDFGDGATSTVENPVHEYAAVDTYQVTLKVTDNDGAETTVTHPVTTVANQPPTAAFTAEVNKRSVAFDASTSSDVDGEVEDYLWDFGDGSPTSTAAKPTHEFPDTATYQVKLTVTDNEGATNTITKPITTVANAKPEAKFSFDVNNLVAEFDATASTDSDGSISSYEWDFGDDGSGSGSKPSHTYATAGAYEVKLTVTDSDGGTDSVTHTVNVSAPVQGALAADVFERTVSNGWGSADTGGAWARYGTASLFSVGDGVGRLRLASAGAGPRVALNGVSSTNTQVNVQFTLDKVPNGSGAFVSVGARAIGTNDYRAKVKIASDGRLTLYLVRVVNNAETTLASKTLSTAYSFSVGTTYNVKVQATGTSPTTVRAKVWKTSQSEPGSWELSETDNNSELQAAGGVGLVGYLSGSSTNFPIVISFDEFEAIEP